MLSSRSLSAVVHSYVRARALRVPLRRIWTVKISPEELCATPHAHDNKKNKRKMAKSDELATKEMPFRCYVGYDSHEDITFEVRVIRSLLLFPLVVRREHFARYVF
jgi:hypothetical protein